MDYSDYRRSTNVEDDSGVLQQGLTLLTHPLRSQWETPDEHGFRVPGTQLSRARIAADFPTFPPMSTQSALATEAGANDPYWDKKSDEPGTIGDLARQDIYPDETGFQPPQNAVGGLTPEDWMMSGQQPPAATYDYVPPQSWLQKAGDLARRDVATYQQGGVPAMMGQLAEDSSGEQDLAGGFGGNIKGVEGKLGALADLTPHAPPFYSAVENAVAGAKQTTAPGQQWAGFLRNQPGVKPEELNTLKLGDLFDQTGAVTKQDLLDHIAANKVQLGEVVKGDSVHQAELARVSAELDALKREEASLPEHALDRRVSIVDEMNALHDRAYDLNNMEGTKFSQYTLPGGENYRETLLTLPDKGQPSDWQVVEHPSGVGYSIRNSRGEYGLTPDGTRDAVFSTPDNARASIADYAATQSERPEFKSSHFDEPNILAHIRTNDRVIDGKKTLFVEEVQSDWHQKGKREGYQEGPTKVTSFGDYARARGYTEKQIKDGFHNLDDPLFNEWDELNKHELAAVERNARAVPDAPFKTTWPDLAMKRVIRQAAEGGYDKVAWTPGSVQADRYDLSKQISKVSYVNNYLNAWDHNGNKVMSRADVKPNDLTDYIGKEAAQKLLDQPPKDYSRLPYVRRGDLKVEQSDYQYHVTNPDGREVAIGKGTVGSEGEALDYAERYLNKSADEINQKRQLAHDNLGPTRELSGLDLKVGGEGMKGFYDQILPAAVNKLVKKHGARVGQSEMTTFPGDAGSIVTQPLPKETAKVHTLDITPQLREMALKKGFPLFTAGGLVAGGAMGDLAKQDDYQ